VATRMVLLRMGLCRAAKSYPVNLSETLPAARPKFRSSQRIARR
jgi:hypothetical protein